MKTPKVILWDIDATLLNFQASEEAGIRMGFAHFHLGECTDEMLARYSAINQKYWEALERGEISKQEVLLGRFETFFAQEGLPVSVARDFNALYQINLGETVFFNDDSYELVKGLHGKVIQCAASNGTKIAQERKLSRSGLDAYLDEVFISEDIGAEKPSPAFYAPVFARFPAVKKEEFLMVGDSLTSDIRGGNNAGIPTCWYNPAGKENNKGVKVDLEIRNLWEIQQFF